MHMTGTLVRIPMANLKGASQPKRTAAAQPVNLAQPYRAKTTNINLTRYPEFTGLYIGANYPSFFVYKVGKT